jgi:hypothetical protein
MKYLLSVKLLYSERENDLTKNLFKRSGNRQAIGKLGNRVTRFSKMKPKHFWLKIILPTWKR